jgi:steroid 5-alpha reductase family enzyme
MISESTFEILLWVWGASAVLTFGTLLFVTAPYGRHGRSGWGAMIPAKAGWILMEMPSATLMVVFFFAAQKIESPVLIAFLVLWQIHYINRTFIFPMRMSKSAKPMPLSIVAFAFIFTLINGAFNGIDVFFLRTYDTSWLTDPRFICGVAVFFLGFAINLRSDAILRNLRKPGETGYKIPTGGMYRFVSCPNYFGEILEWGGWALATWSGAGLVFFIWTFANVAPRGIAHHKWYKENFPEYPKERKAVVPFLF